VRDLERIAAVRGYPLELGLDNGPEIVSVTLAEWGRGAWRNTLYVFQSPNEVREQTDNGMKEDNEERPHESLDDLTPENFYWPKPGSLHSRVVLNRLSHRRNK
jgi:putative transposase